MTTTVPWAFENTATDDVVGMEFLTAEAPTPSVLTQGCALPDAALYFNPCNITIEGGIYYLSFYMCCSDNDAILAQRLALWFGMLKETDHVKLSVSSKLTNIPLPAMTTVLSAIANTQATVEILLDQIVMDSLAYFYLLADKVTARHCGALFIPSFVENRTQDMSGPTRAINDFYQWIVEDATSKGRLTEDEAVRLKTGEHVVVPTGRFSVQ